MDLNAEISEDILIHYMKQELLSHLEYQRNTIRNYEDKDSGYWVHKDDYRYAKKLVKAFKRTLGCYGVHDA